MTNLVEVQYTQTGKSSNTDELGMREMQAMVYGQRHRQHLLVKAPPASGKSRAMMFVALDKLTNQGVRKVIVAVPQQNIGRSFKDTPLKKFGFFADWNVAPYWNLCLNAGSENSKKSIVREFLDHPTATKLVCTHATLLNSLNGIDARKLDNVFFGIDEFHHGSADEDNRLGTLIRR
ncbi:DEAD/DEAH box helicase, partial [Bacteroides acidifaciens]|uniref:DEAD/DEAH box helicase n=1 Tax=Bacteroides acidifaciens TaxID=85831 RepID=UPI00333A2C14